LFIASISTTAEELNILRLRDVRNPRESGLLLEFALSKVGTYFPHLT
jgi:hypothetical protein